MSHSFGLHWQGSPLADQNIALPGKLRIGGLTGGTSLWERAQVVWEHKIRMSEFDAWDQDDQDYALATWRTKQKLENIKIIHAEGKR